ncbi:sensor protein LytS [Striga asiatica]|uniref:Sensor protein LytS n=1 Tax=Striga asiatica TaxID=4170 RepID=A0A5A7Q7I0_STRAF|nr:sensor protein LytS [Striga asiatica]
MSERRLRAASVEAAARHRVTPTSSVEAVSIAAHSSPLSKAKDYMMLSKAKDYTASSGFYSSIPIIWPNLYTLSFRSTRSHPLPLTMTMLQTSQLLWDCGMSCFDFARSGSPEKTNQIIKTLSKDIYCRLRSMHKKEEISFSYPGDDNQKAEKQNQNQSERNLKTISYCKAFSN